MALQIFVLADPKDSTCTEQIIGSCEALGYQANQNRLQALQLHELTSPLNREQMIIGSAVLILIWSQAAAASEEVERLLLFAQRVQKNIIVLILDHTPLPTTLVPITTITTQLPDDVYIAQISALLPHPDSIDALQTLVEQASHQYIRVRKAAIEQAATMLQRNEHKEAVMALLEQMAQHDTITSVRDKAREVFDLYIPARPHSLQTRPQQTQDNLSIFGVRCKNGHVSYFDKHLVCKANYQVPRDLSQSAGKTLDELILSCTTCAETIVAHVDCEGYK